MSCFCAAVSRRPPLYVANHAVLREKRVIKRMVWHKDRRATAAGWTVDSVDADSHDNWAAYHVLKAHGQKLVEGDLFADIQRATDRGLNNHRNVRSLGVSESYGADPNIAFFGTSRSCLPDVLVRSTLICGRV